MQIGSLGTMSSMYSSYGTSRSSGNQGPPPKPDFTELDTDGSGGLNATEFSSLQSSMKAKAPGGGAELSQEDQEAMFAELDADGNGEISEDELATGMEAKRTEMMEEMGGAFGMQGPPPPPPNFTELDSDSSSGLNIDEFMSMQESMAANAPEGAEELSSDKLEEMFAALDTDGSGEISEQELEAGRPQRPQGGGAPKGGMKPPSSASGFDVSQLFDEDSDDASSELSDKLLAMIQNMISKAYDTTSGTLQSDAVSELAVTA